MAADAANRFVSELVVIVWTVGIRPLSMLILFPGYSGLETSLDGIAGGTILTD